MARKTSKFIPLPPLTIIRTRRTQGARKGLHREGKREHEDRRKTRGERRRRAQEEEGCGKKKSG